MKVEISSRAVGQIKSGSLWIFANEFVTRMADLKPGEWVEFESRGQFVGYGYVNPHSLIAGRILSVRPVTDRKTLLFNLLREADKKRHAEKLVGSYRAVFSESDFLPGLIVDVYEKIVVAQFNTAGIDQAKTDLTHGLFEIFEPDYIVIRADSSVRILEGCEGFVETFRGLNQVEIEEAGELRNSIVHEGNISFAADFIGGQKTGFFLDQRENRKNLIQNSEGKSVLDLFSYSGGWGLSALRGKADHVTFVDQSPSAIKLLERGLELNQFSTQKVSLVTSDVFDYLKSDSKTFDIVVCDPPAFVKSKKNLDQAKRAYKKLNLKALEKVKSGGLFYTCSCSYHLSEFDFEQILKEIFQESERLGEVVYRGGQPLDHPWIINRPESRYLKCYCFKVG